MSDVFENKGALAATIVVAASNSLNQGQANYVCDGTNDHVEIQAALDALPATGGEVLLLDGTYHCEATINLDSYQSLRGCGMNTVLTTSTVGLIFLSATGGSGTEKTGIVISNIQIDGATISSYGIRFTYVDYSFIQDVHVWRSNIAAAIYLITSDFNNISGNICRQTNSYGIDIEESNYNKVSRNTVQGCTAEGILLDGTSQGNTILGNIVKENYNGIYAGPSAWQNLIIGNFCEDNGVGIYVRAWEHVIAGNICHSNDMQGIVITENGMCIVVDNLCEYNDLQGIALVDIYIALVGHNFCSANSQEADNTWANILVDDSSEVLVTANICRRWGINEPKYGLFINGLSSRITVQGNDLVDGGQTANFLNNSGGLAIIIRSDNTGITITQIQEYAYVKNTSGGARVPGEVVRHKAVAAGDEYDAPTAVGEDSVLGMVAENMNNNDYGLVQVAGKTTLLKATNAGGGNINIGDYLCTENGIRARLAAAGDMAFARALEACAAADCTIDALLIKPMKI